MIIFITMVFIVSLNQSTTQAPFKTVLNATESTLKTLPGFTNPTPRI